MNQVVTNPFGKDNNQASGIVQVEQSRATQEVQAAMVVAKKFPRNEAEAMDRILKTCTRPTLAVQALYAYPKGNTTVAGPSIRLAEAIAQNWGNIQFGIRELERMHGQSTMEAYAWDLETNTRQSKVFYAEHIRRANGKNKSLDDPRDIYEMTANLGARRLRACILGIIPGDVVDHAVKQVEVTLNNQHGAPEEQITKLVEAFAAFGVTKDILAKRLGHRVESCISAEIINLRTIYTAIRDCVGKPEDYFDMPTTNNTTPPAQTNNSGSRSDSIATKLTSISEPAAPAEEATATDASVVNDDVPPNVGDFGLPDNYGEESAAESRPEE